MPWLQRVSDFAPGEGQSLPPLDGTELARQLLVSPPKTRKVTVRLSEALHERLQLATERPGVGKSMMIEDALDRFLDHVPPIEDLVGERFDEMRVRFDRLERNMQMMGETVSLHARYHLALMPVLPQSRQHEASRAYDRYSRGLMAP